MQHFQKIIDISWPIVPESTSWKDQYPTKFIAERTWETHQARLTTFTMNAHTGTHVDAPSHFLKDGNTIDQLSLHQLIGRCLVIDCTCDDCNQSISKNHLHKFDKLFKKDDIILLKTKNSNLGETDVFHKNFVFLEHEAAQYLVDKGIKCVGIDYIGIERSDIQKNHETHKILLQNGVIIVEGLRLKNVKCTSLDEKGIYTFICLPLYLKGIEGAPARAILLE